jgi:DNA-binding beta-propeller fold protein YncE
MRLRVSHLLLGLTLLTSIARSDEPAADISALEATLTAAEQAETDAIAARLQAESELRTAEQEFQRLERALKAAEAEPAAKAQTLTEKTAAAQPLVDAAAAAQAALDAALAANQPILDSADSTEEQKQAATAAITAAQQALEAANTPLAAANAEVATAQQAADAAVQALTAAQASLAEATRIRDEKAPIATQRAEAVALAAAQRLQCEINLRDALATAGQWVSFAGEVAPILHSRCLACHNARTAKGRLNLDGYANLLQGGESGPSLVAKNHAESPLWGQVHDGSMPQEADPLAPEQVTLIARWIDSGARLDPGLDRSSRLMEILPRIEQPLPPEHYPVPVAASALEISPNGAFVAASGYHEVLVYNIADGSLVHRLHNVAERVYDLSFSPDGQRLAVAAGIPGEFGEVKIFDLAAHTLLADLIRVDDVVLGVAFSPDGSRLATCGADRSIRIFDVSTYAEQHRIEDHADWVLDIAWSPDGTRIVSASRDKTSKVFDTATGDPLTTFNGHGDVVQGVAYLPDGAHAATCGDDNSVRVWVVAEAREVRKLDGAGDDVLALRIGPDGQTYTASVDQQARRYEANTANLVKAYAGHTDWIVSLALHPTTGDLITGSQDGLIKVWTPNGDLVREWKLQP